MELNRFPPNQKDCQMNKKKNKLVVARETLRVLSSTSLTGIAGAMSRHNPGGCNFSDPKPCGGSDLIYGCGGTVTTDDTYYSISCATCAC